MTHSSASAWRGDFEARIGEPVVRIRRVAGGDIGASQRVELASGRVVFLKHYAGAAAGLAASEARGLEWLASAKALRVAKTVAVGDDWLALEWIESRVASPDFDRALGAGLAALHAAGAEEFGGPESNWIGPLVQTNTPQPGWAAFYGHCRLEPLLGRAKEAGLVSDAVARPLHAIVDRLPTLVGPDEAPARLHGDLWRGNVMVDEAGLPCLIDPAVYGGHREVDLAMMKLFGGFSRVVFRAYDEAFPLAAGHEQRIPLYQLYPLLVHVCLFGRSYVSQLAEAADRVLD